MQLRCKIQPFWSIDCAHTLLQLRFKIWKQHIICFYDVIKLFTNRRLFLRHNWVRLQSYGGIILSVYFFILEGWKVFVWNDTINHCLKEIDIDVLYVLLLLTLYTFILFSIVWKNYLLFNKTLLPLKLKKKKKQIL